MSLRKLKRSKSKKTRQNLSAQYGTNDAKELSLMAQRHLRSGNHYEAEKVYKQLVKAFPTNAAAHSDLGTLYHSMGNIDQAVSHYKKAIGLDKNLPQALTNYGFILLDHGKLEEALDLYQKALSASPDFVEAQNGMGLVLKKQGKVEEAVALFKQVLDAAPNNIDALKNLGITYAELGQFEQAAALYEKVVKKNPNDFESLNKYGILQQKCGNLDQAISVFKKVLSVHPESLAARFSLVEALEQYNNVEEAYKEVLEGLKAIPDEASLHALAATCERRLNQFQKGIERLSGLDLKSLSLSYQRQCYFELGRLYDRDGEYDKAFESFTLGNRASSEINSSIDKNYFLERITLLHQQFEECDVLPEADSSLVGRGPVFLFGFPRSGTTLLDQILDSHPMIQSMEEKDIVATIENRLADPFEEYVSLWQQVPPKVIKILQDRYYHEAKRYVQVQPEKVLIDRMPLNTMRAALIWRLFPDAKFILAVRHPLDVCLSCFMQDFRINTANANFFTLEDAAFFYEKVMSLWRLYQKKLPFNFHMVRYEDLVADLEAETRKVLDFLDLSWDENTLNFHEHAKSKGQIKTASYHQVSQPIYKHASYRWQRYEKYCKSIEEELAPFIDHFGYKK